MLFLKILKNKKIICGSYSTESRNTNSSLKNFSFIETVGAGIAQVKGLYKVRAGELVKIYPFNILGLVLNLGENRVGNYPIKFIK